MTHPQPGDLYQVIKWTDGHDPTTYIYSAETDTALIPYTQQHIECSICDKQHPTNQHNETCTKCETPLNPIEALIDGQPTCQTCYNKETTMTTIQLPDTITILDNQQLNQYKGHQLTLLTTARDLLQNAGILIPVKPSITLTETNPQ